MTPLAPHAHKVVVHRTNEQGKVERAELWPVDAREYIAQGWTAGEPGEAPAPDAEAKAESFREQLDAKSKKALQAIALNLHLEPEQTKAALAAAILPFALSGTLSLEEVGLTPPAGLGAGFAGPH